MKILHPQINHRRGDSTRALAFIAGTLIVGTFLVSSISAKENIGEVMLKETEPAAVSAEALAKAAQNPIANMISLPIQNNMDFGLGPKEGFKNTTNIQPVYPFELGDDWNLITRTIVPVIYQSELVEGAGSAFGLGDTSMTGFFSPSDGGAVTWGVGPVFLLPTATDDLLGADKWGAGPSLIVLTMPGKWVIGGLLSNIWSVAGSGDNDINLFTFQYFVNYNFDKGWYFTSAPIINANWEAESGEQWTVPFGGGFGRVFKVGKQPINMQASAYWNAVKPTYGADWQLRLQVVWLFPK